MNRALLESRIAAIENQLAEVKRMIHNYDPHSERQIGVQQIVKKACDVFGIAEDEITRKCRERRYVEARQMAVALIFELIPSMTLTGIGRLFHKHHSSIIHLRKAHGDLLFSSSIYRTSYIKTRDELKQQFSITN